MKERKRTDSFHSSSTHDVTVFGWVHRVKIEGWRVIAEGWERLVDEK